jgi:hypothetical protein
MKKLNLKLANNRLLTKDEMKKIAGSANCHIDCIGSGSQYGEIFLPGCLGGGDWNENRWLDVVLCVSEGYNFVTHTICHCE